MCCNSLLSRKTALKHFKTSLGPDRNRFDLKKKNCIAIKFPIQMTQLKYYSYLLKTKTIFATQQCWHSSIQHEPVEVALHHDKVSSVIRENFVVNFFFCFQAKALTFLSVRIQCAASLGYSHVFLMFSPSQRNLIRNPFLRCCPAP